MQQQETSMFLRPRSRRSNRAELEEALKDIEQMAARGLLPCEDNPEAYLALILECVDIALDETLIR